MLTWSASAAASAVPALAACTCPAPHQLGNGSRDEVITGAGRQQQPFVGLALAAWQPQAAPHEGFGRHGLRGGVHRCNGWQTVPAVTAPPGLALPPCRFFSTVVPGWRVARPWPLFAAQGVRASARGCRSGTSGVSGRRFAPSTLTCRGSCRRCMGCMGQRGFKEGGVQRAVCGLCGAMPHLQTQRLLQPARHPAPWTWFAAAAPQWRRWRRAANQTRQLPQTPIQSQRLPSRKRWTSPRRYWTWLGELAGWEGVWCGAAQSRRAKGSWTGKRTGT